MGVPRPGLSTDGLRSVRSSLAHAVPSLDPSANRVPTGQELQHLRAPCPRGGSRSR